MFMQHEAQFKNGFTSSALVTAVKDHVGALGLKISAQSDDWVLCENWVLGEERHDELLLVQAVRVGDRDCYAILVAVAQDERWASRIRDEAAGFVRGVKTL